MTRTILPLSSRSTRASVGATELGTADAIDSVLSVDVDDSFVSVPPVAAFSRDASPSRV